MEYEEVVYWDTCNEQFESIPNGPDECNSFLDETTAIKAAQDYAYKESLAKDHANVHVIVCVVVNKNFTIFHLLKSVEVEKAELRKKVKLFC